MQGPRVVEIRASVFDARTDHGVVGLTIVDPVPYVQSEDHAPSPGQDAGAPAVVHPKELRVKSCIGDPAGDGDGDDIVPVVP